MKKFLLLLVLLNGFVLQAGYCKQQEADADKREETRKQVEAKKKELNGSQWEILLVSSAGPKAKSEQDVLTFQNGQVSSKVFSASGFQPTNYTITIQEGTDETVWETMQTDPKEGVVFIRGEWKGDTMHGIVSQQLEGGKTTRDYNFSTVKKESVPPTTASAKAETKPAEVSTTPAAVQADEPATTKEKEQAPPSIASVSDDKNVKTTGKALF